MLYDSTPFSEYILHSQELIKRGRRDSALPNINPAIILEANSPYELVPSPLSKKGYKVGALLIHGLLDSPFTLREIGTHLQKNGVLCRSVLLPGHGTHPEDLLHVRWEDWTNIVRYGINTFQQEVERLFLIGYSTGATVSLYHALENPHLSGLIFISPAIKMKTSIEAMINLQRLIGSAGKHRKWIYRQDELDYTKYQSIPFHAIDELSTLTAIIEKRYKEHTIQCPVWITMSHQDQTVSCEKAIELFKSLPNPINRFLLYTSKDESFDDKRIIKRRAYYPNLHIHHFSHSALPFSPQNFHYGQQGDYVYASHSHLKDLIFGAYNDMEIDMYKLLHQFNIVERKRRELSYNPDFDFMVNELTQFILT